MKEVLITVKSRQDIPDSEPSIIEITTRGSINQKDGKIYLSYDESKTLSVDNASTVIKVDGKESVVLKRSGDVNSRMIIEPGRRNSCFYTTKEGSIALGIFGFNINNSLSINGGNLDFEYAIDVNSTFISKNRVEIFVKEV